MDEDDHRILYHGKSPGVTVEIALDRVRGKKSTWISAARLAELYNLADVVITKPGGGVTAEAALMGVPIVFDGTEGFLHWEQVNCEATRAFFTWPSASSGDPFSHRCSRFVTT